MTIEVQSLQSLASDYLSVRRIVEEQSLALKDIGGELINRMKNDKASEVVDIHGEIVSLVTTPGYDENVLVRLLEVDEVTSEELIKSGAFTPAHQETKTVPARWNMTKAKVFRKRGGSVPTILDEARYVKSERLE
jgi:hypothetical protein